MEEKNSISLTTTIVGIIILCILNLLYTLMNIAPYYIYASGEMTYDIRGVSLIYVAAILIGYIFLVNILYCKFTLDKNMLFFLATYSALVFTSLFILLISVLKGRTIELKSFIEFCILWVLPCISLFIGIEIGKITSINIIIFIFRVTISIMFFYFIFLFMREPFMLFHRPYAVVSYMLFLSASIEIWYLVKNRLTMTGILSIIISILLMLISGTRSVILSLFVFTLFLLAINKKYKALIIMLLTFLIFIVLFNTLQFYNPSLIRIQEATRFDISIFKGRSVIWESGWNIFIKNPLLGSGWDAFRTNVNLTEGKIKIINAHNLFLRILIDMGIVGLIVYVVFIIATIKLFIKNDYCITLIFSILSSAFYSDLPELYPYDFAKLFQIVLFWLLIGYFYSLNMKCKINNFRQKLTS